MYLRCTDAMYELGFITERQLNEECIKLVRSTYDAALRCQKCLVQTCRDSKGDIECEQSKVDPCLLLKKAKERKVALSIVCYMDNVLLSGTKEEIKSGKKKEHLETWYKWKKDKNNEPYIHVAMDNMLKETVKTYEEITKKEVKLQDKKIKH